MQLRACAATRLLKVLRLPTAGSLRAQMPFVHGAVIAVYHRHGVSSTRRRVLRESDAGSLLCARSAINSTTPRAQTLRHSWKFQQASEDVLCSFVPLALFLQWLNDPARTHCSVVVAPRQPSSYSSKSSFEETIVHQGELYIVKPPHRTGETSHLYTLHRAIWR